MDTSYRDRLVGGYRLLRIRNIRAWTHAALILAASGLSAAALADAGASLKPIFVPIGALLPPVLVTALIAATLGMFYRALEIKHAAHDAHRYLMVTSAMERLFIIIFVCAVIAAVLLFPATRLAIAGPETTTPVAQTLPYSASSAIPAFDNQDSLGLVRYASLLVDVLAGRGVEVTIEKDAQLPLTEVVLGRILLEIPLDVKGVHTYVISLSNPNPEPVTFTYALRRVVMPTLLNAVPGFALGLLVASVAFFVYLRPQRVRYQGASVFSAEYHDVVAPGERLYNESGPQPAAQVSQHIPSPGMSPPPLGAAASIPVPAALSFQTSGAAGETPMSATGSTVVLKSRSPEEIFTDGARFYSMGQYDAALQRFDEILGLQPRAPTALLARGNTLLKLGRVGEAHRMFDEVLAMNPTEIGAFAGRADAYAQERRWRDVLEVSDAGLVAHPGNSDILERRGDALLALSHRQEAQIAFEAALARKPGDPSLIAKLEQSKVDVAALQSRALIASASGNLDEALLLLSQVLRLEPENVNVLVAKASALRRAGRLDEALECLDEALSRKPDHGGALLTQGRVLEDRGDLEDALDAYDKLLELNPKDTDAWVAQGNVLLKMGRDDDASKSYREALKDAPDDEDLQARVNGLESTRVQQDRAMRELFQLRGIGPGRARALQEAGFRTVEDFRKATEGDLMKVHGITRKLAEEIIAHFRAK